MSTQHNTDDGQVEEPHPPSNVQPRPEGATEAVDRFRQQMSTGRADRDDTDDEQSLWSGGYSPKDMFGTWGLLAVISVAIVLVAILAPPFAAVLLLIPVIWIVGGLRYAWRRLGVHYQLTSQRFIHQQGILTRKTDRIEVIDIDDVGFMQGPIQRTLGVGKIVLTGSDRTHPTLTMYGIADVREVAGLIDDVRRKERRSRSVHVEQL